MKLLINFEKYIKLSGAASQLIMGPAYLQTAYFYYVALSFKIYSDFSFGVSEDPVQILMTRRQEFIDFQRSFAQFLILIRNFNMLHF